MIKVYFSDFKNFGDALNRHLIERLTGDVVQHSSYSRAELMGAGSIFYGGGFFWGDKGRLLSRNRMRYYWRKIRDSFNPELDVWGSGVLFDLPISGECVHYRTMNIHAVRGRETVRILKRAGFLNDGSMPALGDPGLLYPHLIKGVSCVEKLYDLAIVPHYLDYKVGVELGEFLLSKGINVKVVDVMQPDPLNVIREIVFSRKVASASLHGLIVADSMNIPNRHLVLSDYEVDRYHGQGAFMLKFKDYYSALGMDPRPYMSANDFKSNAKKSIASIEGPSADVKTINKVKMSLLNAFPKKFMGRGYSEMYNEIKDNET